MSSKNYSKFWSCGVNWGQKLNCSMQKILPWIQKNWFLFVQNNIFGQFSIKNHIFEFIGKNSASCECSKSNQFNSQVIWNQILTNLTDYDLNISSQDFVLIIIARIMFSLFPKLSQTWKHQAAACLCSVTCYNVTFLRKIQNVVNSCCDKTLWNACAMVKN
jgi:hypothetical protein